VLTTTSGGSVTDGNGNAFTLTAAGVVEQNGAPVPGGSGTAQVTSDASGTIWGQDASSGNWYAWRNGTWAGPASSPIGSNVCGDCDCQIVLTTTSGGSIQDDSSNVWTLTSGGAIAENGSAVAGGGGSSGLTFASHTIWGRDASSGSWYAWTGTTWTGPGANPVGGNVCTQAQAQSCGGGDGSGSGSDGGGNGAPLIQPPLNGATPGTWQQGDVQTSSMRMHFNYLLPYGYSPAHSYPVLVWEHENDMGDSYYDGGDPFGLAGYVDGWFNTSAFRTKYPAIIVLPYADQRSDPGGETSNFGGWTQPGDHGPNEDAVVAVVEQIESSFSVYPRKIYVTGASLGGIGSWALMLDYNAINGPFGHVFAAGLPMAGVIERYGFGVDPPQAVIDQMRNVPVFAVHGSGDGTSQPNWDRAMWHDYGGGNFPGNPGAGAPNGAFHYLEDPGLGHDVWDTYAGLPNGAPLYDWMFAQTAP
jgi:hypothetical protein